MLRGVVLFCNRRPRRAESERSSAAIAEERKLLAGATMILRKGAPWGSDKNHLRRQK